MKARNSRRSVKRKSADSENDTSTAEDLEFLKSMFVINQSKDLIKKKLKSTLDARVEMVKDVECDLLEQFPFFFSNPELVNMCIEKYQMKWNQISIHLNYIYSEFNHIFHLLAGINWSVYLQILTDYDLRFRNCKNYSSNLIDNNWASYSVCLNEMLTTKYASHIYTQWSKDIQDILILLKLLPVKNHSKATASLESFNKAIDKIFLFRQV